jgi:hypothetical protein
MIARSEWNTGSKTPPVGRFLAVVGITAVTALIAACGTQNNSTAQRVESWVSSTGLDAGIAQIRADAANVAKVEGLGNPGAIRTNCAVLDLDTESANQNLPSPAQQLTTELSDAYAAEIQAAQDCFHGAGKSKTLISRGKIAQSAADADINQALALVAQLTAKSAG